jgi:DNA modification methylase
MEASSSLEVVQIKLSELRPAVYNPRKISDKDFEQLVQSIKQFTMIEPLVVNSSKNRYGVIIGGHQRYAAAVVLNYKTVPVVFINLSEELERQLNLRLNRNTGQFDLDLLKHFDIEMLLEVGFDDIDLSNIWDDALTTEDDEFDVDKALDETKVPVAQIGDLYQLGDHRLICGDSTDPATINRLMDGKQAAMLNTDPKYNIKLDYNTGISTDGKYGGTTNDSLSDADYEIFLKSALGNAIAVLHPDAHAFCYCDQLYTGLIQKIYGELGFSTKRVCLWVKNNFNMTPQLAFNKAYEPCVYATRGKPYLSETHNLTEILNREIAPGNRTIDDIIDLFDIWLAKRDPAISYQHPTQKPPTLHDKALRRCSKPGDIILDVFAGSGSLMVACEQLKRSCYMSELEPIFCDVIISRYEQLTGQKAVKL